jgi:hypothetical protein
MLPRRLLAVAAVCGLALLLQGTGSHAAAQIPAVMPRISPPQAPAAGPDTPGVALHFSTCWRCGGRRHVSCRNPNCVFGRVPSRDDGIPIGPSFCKGCIRGHVDCPECDGRGWTGVRAVPVQGDGGTEPAQPKPKPVADGKMPAPKPISFENARALFKVPDPQNYAGKWVTFHGRASSVNPHFVAFREVEPQFDGTIYFVWCYFDEETKDEVAKLQRSDEVTITGQVVKIKADRSADPEVSLEHCRFAPATTGSGPPRLPGDTYGTNPVERAHSTTSGNPRGQSSSADATIELPDIRSFTTPARVAWTDDTAKQPVASSMPPQTTPPQAPSTRSTSGDTRLEEQLLDLEWKISEKWAAASRIATAPVIPGRVDVVPSPDPLSDRWRIMRGESLYIKDANEQVSAFFKEIEQLHKQYVAIEKQLQDARRSVPTLPKCKGCDGKGILWGPHLELVRDEQGDLRLGLVNGLHCCESCGGAGVQKPRAK